MFSLNNKTKAFGITGISDVKAAIALNNILTTPRSYILNFKERITMSPFALKESTNPRVRKLLKSENKFKQKAAGADFERAEGAEPQGPHC